MILYYSPNHISGIYYYIDSGPGAEVPSIIRDGLGNRAIRYLILSSYSIKPPAPFTLKAIRC